MCTYNVETMTELLLQSGYADKDFSPGHSTLVLDKEVKKNDVKSVRALLESNSNLSPSALSSVMWFAIYKKYNNIVETLIKLGADVNQRGLRSRHCDPRNSLLSWAVYFKNKEAVNLLIKHKANVNDWDLLGIGALYFALVTNSLFHTNLLLEHGANVNCKDDDENSMLHIAAASGNHLLIKVIGERMTDVNDLNQFKQNALHFAIQSTNVSLSVVKQLLNLNVSLHALDEADETPLFYALSLRKDAISKLLLNHGALVNLTSKNHVFPLHLCIASKCSCGVTKIILKAGALVNQQTYDGETVLHCACRNKMNEHVKILLKSGANINAYNKKGKLPVSDVNKHDVLTAQVLMQHIVMLRSLNKPVRKTNLKIIQDEAPFKAYFENYFGAYCKERNELEESNRLFPTT